jgi:hypothetical protein
MRLSDIRFHRKVSDSVSPTKGQDILIWQKEVKKMTIDLFLERRENADLTYSGDLKILDSGVVITLCSYGFEPAAATEFLKKYACLVVSTMFPEGNYIHFEDCYLAEDESKTVRDSLLRIVPAEMVIRFQKDLSKAARNIFVNVMNGLDDVIEKNLREITKDEEGTHWKLLIRLAPHLSGRRIGFRSQGVEDSEVVKSEGGGQRARDQFRDLTPALPGQKDQVHIM